MQPPRGGRKVLLIGTGVVGRLGRFETVLVVELLIGDSDGFGRRFLVGAEVVGENRALQERRENSRSQLPHLATARQSPVKRPYLRYHQAP